MTKPTPFKRGTAFSFVIETPSTTPDGFFMDWEVKAQIRKQNNSNPSGLIANLSTSWDDTEITRNLTISDNFTDTWPIGLAEVDVLFMSSTGQKIRSSVYTFDIIRGITQ